MEGVFETYSKVMQVATWVVAVIFLVSGVDELVTTVMFFIWRFYRRFFLVRDNPRLSVTKLNSVPQKTAAIMVPAWHEDAVIGDMLRFAISEIEYSEYIIVVGVYPNDTATQQAVRAVIKEHPSRVRMAIVPNPGPTTKSDCLNAIIREALAWEKENIRTIAFFVLQDAEDYVPRYGLKLFNFLIPRKSLVQIPVFPLSVPWWSFTEGHYMDEFALQHLKDLRVREWLTGGIPSAGVGTAFSREAIKLAWVPEINGPFRKHLLTEDYEISMQLLKRGAPSAFFIGSIEGAQRSRKDLQLYALPDMAVVRGEFPKKMWASVRQKTRWALGITFQGWESMGWWGNGWQRYMLFRDRKSIFTNFANIAAYLFFLAWIIPWALQKLVFHDWALVAVYEAGSWLETIIISNLALLGFFMLVRASCTYFAYGPLHAVLSAPRAVWGNLINFLATLRAMKQYLEARRKGIKNIPWEKTSHGGSSVD